MKFILKWIYIELLNFYKMVFPEEDNLKYCEL